MKKVLFALFLPIVALAMGGCRKAPSTPALSISPSEDIVFEAVGGSARVGVTTNQVQWNVRSNRSWCVVEKTTDDSAFEVKVGVNKSMDEMRGAQITVTAGNGREDMKSIVLTVRQRGGEPLFDIEISNITDTSAELHVVPLDPEENYFCDILEKSNLELFEKDLAAYVDALFDFAGQWYGTPENAVKLLTDKGEQHKTVDKLLSDNECVSFAVGIDVHGKRTTEIIEGPTFRTKEKQ